MLRRIGLGALVAGVVAGLLVAVTRSDEGLAYEVGTHGAGTPLFEGLVVEEGSRLVGIPGKYDIKDRLAVLLVDGDPAQVFDRYVQQIADRGWDVTTSQVTDCYEPGFTDYQRCRTEGDVELELAWTSGPTAVPHVPWAQHLLVSVGPESLAVGEPKEVDLDELGPPSGVLERRGAPSLPPVGETMAEFLSSGNLTLVPGSRLLAPAVPSDRGTVAVIEITGDPRTVVEGYVDQYDANPDATITESEANGQHVIDATVDEAGGGKLTLHASGTDSDGWYAVLVTGYD